MKAFEVIISGSAQPQVYSFDATNLEQAFQRVKHDVQADAIWDMYPIWQGEARVDSAFKMPGSNRRYRVVVHNNAFKRARS